MTNLAAAVERVKWLVNHNAKMEMIDRSDLETILAELGRLSQECEGTECPLCNGTGKRMVNSFADHTKQIENTCSGCRGKGVIGQNRPPVAGLAELTKILNFLDKIPRAIAAYGREGERRWNEGNTIHLTLGPKHYEAMALHDELQKVREFLENKNA